MRVLITGNQGYVGPAVAQFIKKNEPSAQIIGFDAGFFAHALTAAERLPETLYERQYAGDVREFPVDLLEGVDAVVHLAAVSNDPMGKEFEAVTDEINRRASVNFAKMAARAGVKNFVFASSCSMYGAADGGAPRSERDATNPLTAYARSKIGTEVDLAGEDLGGMTFTSLRFATACGMSERLRLDLVLNDFVACALLDKKITVLSDGSPWRPLIDVEDMGRVIWWACNRDSSDGGHFLAVNAGRDEGNYQVRDLASAVASAIGGVDVAINTAAPPDGRSYKVDFTLLRGLAPNAVPRVSLEESIQRLTAGIKQLHFKDSDFRNSSYIRLHLLRKHIAAGRLAADLRWSNL